MPHSRTQSQVVHRTPRRLGLLAALAASLLAPLTASALDGQVDLWMDCNNPVPSSTVGPAPVPVSDSDDFLIDGGCCNGDRTGEGTATVTASEITTAATVTNAYTAFGAYVCTGAYWSVTDLIFHSASGNGGTADVRVKGHAVGSGGSNCGASLIIQVGGSFVVAGIWTGGGSFDVEHTSSVITSVPLDTPLVFRWGYNGRNNGSTGCLAGPGQSWSMSAEATLGDIHGEVFEVSNINPTEGPAEVVDIESVMLGISNNQIGGGAGVPSGGPATWLAMAALIGGAGGYAARRRAAG